VTGENPGVPPGKRWASTGEREISSAVRLGSQDGISIAAAALPFSLARIGPASFDIVRDDIVLISFNFE
jgi:hypothetical protein